MNHYADVTKEKILKKATRKRRPVTTLYGLAEEFRAPTYSGGRTSGGFRQHVVTTLGPKTYSRIFGS